MQALQLVTAPSVEPLTLADAKTHLRVVDTSDDTYITSLITVARRAVEEFTRRALITQTWRLTLDSFPGPGFKSAFEDPWLNTQFGPIRLPNLRWYYPIPLPRPRLISVSGVTYVDPAGVTQTLDPSQYQVDDQSEPARLLPTPNGDWPQTQQGSINTVQVTYSAGYGATAGTVEPMIVHAIRLWVGHLYANREPVAVGVSVEDMPKTIADLLWPHRVF